MCVCKRGQRTEREREREGEREGERERERERERESGHFKLIIHFLITNEQYKINFEQSRISKISFFIKITT